MGQGTDPLHLGCVIHDGLLDCLDLRRSCFQTSGTCCVYARQAAGLAVRAQDGGPRVVSFRRRLAACRPRLAAQRAGSWSCAKAPRRSRC